MIRCNICNGPLHMNPDGRGATCQDCGIFYPLDALRRMTDAERLRRASVSALYAPPEVMFAQHNRREPPRPAPVYGAPPFGIRRNVRPEPPRPAQSGSLPEHHIRNENRGVSLAERRRSPDYRMPKYDGPVKPSAPGIFASFPSASLRGLRQTSQRKIRTLFFSFRTNNIRYKVSVLKIIDPRI